MFSVFRLPYDRLEQCAIKVQIRPLVLSRVGVKYLKGCIKEWAGSFSIRYIACDPDTVISTRLI